MQATEQRIAKAPVGNQFHRVYACKVLEPSRLQHASGDDRGRTKDGWGSGSAAMERALVPRPPAPLTPPAPEATFHWKVKPTEQMTLATFYIDGSALDGAVL